MLVHCNNIFFKLEKNQKKGIFFHFNQIQDLTKKQESTKEKKSCHVLKKNGLT